MNISLSSEGMLCTKPSRNTRQLKGKWFAWDELPYYNTLPSPQQLVMSRKLLFSYLYYLCITSTTWCYIFHEDKEGIEQALSM